MYTLPKLEYSYDSLEPFIDAATMEIHYTKHHQAYIDKLNAALESHPKLQDLPIEDLLRKLNTLPKEIQTQVKNHGGGHANHSFWWLNLKKNTKFDGEISKEIKKKFGSYDKFKEEFIKTALSVFGSGWGWLILNKDNNLEIIKTPNQDSPLMEGNVPLLGVDMWEHSFYLKHGPNKTAYMEDFFKVINWENVNKNFEKAK
ncbi:MAG: superoxide dismutase [Nanoarchaeota archaeon]|nr:superoxide dismutase [Nanoarchaeota archaeon]